MCIVAGAAPDSGGDIPILVQELGAGSSAEEASTRHWPVNDIKQESVAEEEIFKIEITNSS